MHLMFLDEGLHRSFIMAHILTGDQSQRVQHPCVHVIGVCEELWCGCLRGL